MSSGFSHIGVSTLDMNKTIEFYTDLLRFPLVADHRTRIREGGEIRQAYFDVGADEFLVFMEPRNVAGIPNSYPTGINAALGTPAGMYHLSFKVSSLEDLEKRRGELLTAGIEVSAVIDLDHAQSIFFADPNDLQLEFCTHIRAFRADDIGHVSEATIA